MDASVPTPDLLPSFSLWTGCYTADGHGTGEGIGVIHVENGVPSWSHLAARTPSPSFLAKHPSLPVLYAAGEMAQTLSAFHIDGPGRLAPLGTVRHAGDAVCHVAVAPQGRYVIACCWGDGQVLCYPVGDDGSLGDALPAPAALDPHAAAGIGGRRTRAHCALMLGDGRIATTDLGYDLVRIWRYDAREGLVADHEVALPPGSEPRHLVQHPSGRLLVVGEASLVVFVLVRDENDRFHLESSCPIAQEPRGGGRHRAGATASEISLDASGRFALVAVRGSDEIVTLAVSGDGTTLTPVSRASCGGTTPRHHLQIGPVLLVANQGSDSVTAFRLAEHTGTVLDQIADIAVGTPSCLVAA